MLTRYACTAAELSCVIGNIFAELSPPCAACGAEVLQITGTTVTGNAATLTVTEAGFDFDGCADDTAMIERMRKGRCIAEAPRGYVEQLQRQGCSTFALR